MLSDRERVLGDRLEQIYAAYGPATVDSDPIVFVGRYETDSDREVVGWIASAFAYGRVATIQANVQRILTALGPSPAQTVDGISDFRRFARERLAGFRDRFHGPEDAAALLFAIASARRASGAGTVRGFFEGEMGEGDRDVAGLLDRAVARLEALDWREVLGGRSRRLPDRHPARFFFPSPASGSACKRWNLYLRWMVRRDGLDFGLWTGIPTSRLVMPTDTHIHLIARRLLLTRRRTADWRTAREITDRLARFDPADPVRFDYALCRIGIFGICQAAPGRSRCLECAARDACPTGLLRRARAA